MIKLGKGLIVSCQAEEGSPFNSRQFIAAFAVAAELGGAIAVRVRDPENVAAVKMATRLPIIGLTKASYPDGNVLITPSIGDVQALVDAGADFVAVDATNRNRPDGIAGPEFLRFVKSKIAKPVIADISNLDEALVAVDAGADYVATTLSGYTGKSDSPKDEPDFELVRSVSARTRTPVIAEGRVWTPEQAREVLESGAHAVCVGTAITRPVAVIARFVKALSVNRPAEATR